MSNFHSLKERLETVLKVKSGAPIVQLCKELHTGRDQILEWVRRYDALGEAGLVRHKPYKQISCAEKERLVRLYLEKDLSLREIYTSADISRTNLETWIRIVRNRGYSALYEVGRRGRKPKEMKQQKQEKYEPKAELERLQAENLRLRAENALLKKAKALMEEEESRLKGFGQRSSKH